MTQKNQKIINKEDICKIPGESDILDENFTEFLEWDTYEEEEFVRSFNNQINYD